MTQRGHQKLIAAQPTNDIVLLFFCGQTLAHFNQELVACFMPIPIVNQFKIVQIDKRNDGVTFQVPSQGKQSSQILKDGATIGQAGKGIGIRVCDERRVSFPKLVHQRFFLNVLTNQPGE